MVAFKLWSRVPDGSKLEMRIESEDDGWVSGARLVDDLGHEELWEHDQLHPGPKVKRLTAPRVYTVRTRIAFLAAEIETVVLKARIVTPDGTTHGTPYITPVSGKKGAIKRATIVVAMLKS